MIARRLVLALVGALLLAATPVLEAAQGAVVGKFEKGKDPRSAVLYKGVRNLWGPPVQRVESTPVGIQSHYRIVGHAYHLPGWRNPSVARRTHHSRLFQKTSKKARPVPSVSVPRARSRPVTTVRRSSRPRKAPAPVGMRSLSGSSDFRLPAREGAGYAD